MPLPAATALPISPLITTGLSALSVMMFQKKMFFFFSSVEKVILL
jgi:hypothetical protein